MLLRALSEIKEGEYSLIYFQRSGRTTAPGVVNERWIPDITLCSSDGKSVKIIEVQSAHDDISVLWDKLDLPKNGGQ